jgi:histone H3/H4
MELSIPVTNIDRLVKSLCDGDIQNTGIDTSPNEKPHPYI